jgi:pullulanase
MAVFTFYKKLIALRKAHPAFRMTDAGQVAQNIKFLDASNNVITYTIDGAAMGDSWKQILVVYNGNPTAKPFTLPKGKWKAFVIDNALVPKKARPSAKVGAWGMSVYYQ